MKLRELAHSRTGDKGDYSVISVIAFKPEHYGKIKEELTVDVVKKRFSEICKGKITRYELPKIHSFIFELEHALGGGVTRSLAMDAHGKSLCYIMLDTELSDN
jgi:hypothetical protein